MKQKRHGLRDWLNICLCLLVEDDHMTNFDRNKMVALWVHPLPFLTPITPSYIIDTQYIPFPSLRHTHTLSLSLSLTILPPNMRDKGTERLVAVRLSAVDMVMIIMIMMMIMTLQCSKRKSVHKVKIDKVHNINNCKSFALRIKLTLLTVCS